MTPENPEIRVRIAPSPTGALHLGTARTALFNFLFARKHGGSFILRIEDTDVERSSLEFEKDILENLRWLGIQWDEGPEADGEFGPYKQSERTASYQAAIEKLFASQSAYYCFCTAEELEHERELQQQRGEPLRYSGTCRMLEPRETRRRVDGGEAAVIRFRVSEKAIPFTDLIRGELIFDGTLIGDIIIAKSRTQPLYNFTAVVDDAEMHISHVLRGEDHITNTPKQIAIAEALGISPPRFGHFPLILGPDRSKLSKRHGATSVQELRGMGYFPEAVVNFLALLGWNPGTEQEVFSMDELIATFDISRVQKSGAVWNQEKLEWFNRQFFHHPRWLTKNTIPTDLFAYMGDIVARKNWEAKKEQLERIALIILERTPLKDLETALAEEYTYFFETPDVPKDLLAWKKASRDDAHAALQKCRDVLGNISENEWNISSLQDILFTTADEWGSGDKGKLLWPLRVALSGKKQSPSPFEIATIVGKEETLKRIGIRL